MEVKGWSEIAKLLLNWKTDGFRQEFEKVEILINLRNKLELKFDFKLDLHHLFHQK